MKIGIVTEYFFPTIGGIVENIYHMSRELLRRGHDLRIITGFRKGLPDNIDDEIIRRLIYIGRSTPTFFNGTCGCVTTGFGLTRKMKEVFRSEKFDIIHIHSPVYPTLSYIANLQANAPMVATYHTCTDITLLYKLGQSRLQMFLSRIAGHIAVSKCCAVDNNRFFDVNFDILPNGVDVDWWKKNARKIDRFDDGKINILFIGRPDCRNGLDVLIPAFARVHKKHPDTRLIVVGDGPLRFFFERMVPENIKDSVTFEGTVLDERPSYMASSHLQCFTPEIASFGVTILEAMSGGMPMVASDIEPFRQLVTNEESALLVDPKDEDALVNALERLVVDDELRERLGATAAMRVDHYDWKRITELHLEYYRKIGDLVNQ